MNFLAALKEAERGAVISRKSWSDDASSDDFRFDVIVDERQCIRGKNRNARFDPFLRVADVEASDWYIKKEA